MLKRIVKILVYSCFIIMMFYPLRQMVYPIKKEIKPLKGAVTIAQKPKLNLKDWMKGDYQEKFESYINDNIGFRPWLVRLHNQFRFSVFNKANARGVIRGEENYLYELNYIKAYNGEDFIGSAKIEEHVAGFKQLQDKLAQLDKILLICLTPGKASFYPEYFPKNMRMEKTDSTNYKRYVRYLKKYNVNHIDMNKWFVEMKDTCGCMLYPKYGIHWSFYGMMVAADSIIKYIETKRKIDMPNIEITGMERSNLLKNSDYDIAEGMNLFYQMKTEPMCYPRYRFSNDGNIVKPRTLVVSDSFYWSMFNIGMGSHIFDLGGFWYYNKQIYPDSYKSPLTVDDVDIKERILDNEVVILMSTEANLPMFSWGFVENASRALDKSNN